MQILVSVLNNGEASSSVGATGTVTSVSSTIYDSRGQAIWSDDEHQPGRAADGTLTTYNPDGTVAATQRFSGVDIEPGVDASGAPTTFLSGTPAPLASAATTTYDGAGRVSSTTDESGHTVTYGYDQDGRQTTVTDTVMVLGPDGQPTPVTRTTTSTYDKAGRLASTTNALNQTTRYDLDADGRTIATHYADGTTTATAYDPTTGRKKSDTDQDGQTTSYTYYPNGNLWTVTLPAVVNALDPNQAMASPVSTYTYDPDNNLATQTDPLGHQTTYTTDAFGNRTAEALPDGVNTETWAYNPQGQLASAVDFDGQVTDTTYDDQGRVATQSEYATAAAERAGTPTKTITYAYDLYDPSGRRYDTVTVNDAAAFNDDGTSTYYDTEGRTVEVDSPQGRISFEYDPTTGQKRRVFTGDTAHPTTDLRYAYDATGRLSTVTAVTLDGATLATPLVTSYFYDLDDNLVATHMANNTWEYRTYDPLDRLLSVDDVSTDGSKVLAGSSYTLDPTGRRLTMADDTNRPVTLTIDGNGDVHLALGNSPGRTVTYTYDHDGRLTAEVVTNDPTDPSGSAIRYTYDLAGNRATLRRYDSGAPLGGDIIGDPSISQDTYTYDEDDRLIEDHHASGFAEGETLGGGSGGGSGTDRSTDTQYTYDADGNTLTVVVHDGTSTGAVTSTTTDTWDIEGHLVGVVVRDGSGTITSATDFAYDAGGDRVAQRTGGVTTSYLNDPSDAYDRALEEYSGGMRAATYVRGLDLLFEDRTGADKGSSGVSFYAVDGLGSTRALVSSAGVVTDTDTYDAFGDTLATTGTTTNPYLYAGQGLDAATGLYEDTARYYQASAGRFTSRDSYDGVTNQPITTNHYLYADANPINIVDPSGHDGEITSTEVSIEGGETLSALDTAGAQIVRNSAIRNAAAFQARGATLGLYGNELGAATELLAGRIIGLIPKLAGRFTEGVKLAKSLGATTGSKVDYVINFGSRYLQLEVKYGLPKQAGEAFTRLTNQMINMVLSGRGQAVVWSLREPTVATLNKLQAAVGTKIYNQVQFVYGVNGLYNYLKLYFRM